MLAWALGYWPSLRSVDKGIGTLVDKVSGGLAIAILSVTFYGQLSSVENAPNDTSLPSTAEALPDTKSVFETPGREIFLAGYGGPPFYHRSDVHLVRPDGTDLTLKKLGWDGDVLHFPIDGGIRSVEWWNSVGFMVDFLHNKAVSRLGKGAHGRKQTNPIIEQVEAEGKLNGQPVAPRVKLTDIFSRFEFTHGHNTLLFTGMFRPAAITPRLRPYFGVGAGFAIPHTEVWFPGGKREERTNEYQFAGPAAQVVAGLEFRTGKVSYFFEYKFTWARISGLLTGDESWLDFMMPGDLYRQLKRWWRGEEPKYGRFQTTLAAHQVVGGAGYWWNVRRGKP